MLFEEIQNSRNLNFHPGPTKFQLNMVLEEMWLEEDGCHLGYWNRTILAILNDHPTNFWLNLIQ